MLDFVVDEALPLKEELEEGYLSLWFVDLAAVGRYDALVSFLIGFKLHKLALELFDSLC